MGLAISCRWVFVVNMVPVTIIWWVKIGGNMYNTYTVPRKKKHKTHVPANVKSYSEVGICYLCCKMVSEELARMLQNDPQLGVDVSEGSGQTEAKAQERESRDLKENKTEYPASAPGEGRKRSRPGGLNKVCGVSPELQAIVGQATMPRTQIVKQLWMYIRANNLQDPSNKRNIICDDALRLVFDTDSTDMFQMNKLLARHIWAIDSVDDDLEPNAKRIGNGSAARLISTAPISDSLASFLGTSKIEKPMEEVAKHVWNYITENNLQDMLDKEKVNCDEKLEKLFDCENFNESEMIKLLAPHFSRG